jgi:hypothetical protein
MRTPRWPAARLEPTASDGMDFAEVTAGGHRWQGSQSLVRAWSATMLGVDPPSGPPGPRLPARAVFFARS